MGSVIEKFAETHRLRVSKDECGDPVIPGRKRHQLFDNGDGRLASCWCSALRRSGTTAES